MPKQVRDWNKVKIEFLQDEIDDVSVFFKTRYGKRDGNTAIKTNGRSREKMEFKNEIEKKVIEKLKAKIAKEYAIPKEQLLSMKKNAVNLLIKRLNNFVDTTDKDGKIIQKGEKVSVRDIKDIIQTVKVELQEPITISKNFNANTEIELDEEEEEEVKSLLKENGML